MRALGLDEDAVMFSWNGENRLIQASNATHVISCAYDYQVRMFQKIVDGVTNSYV